MTLTQTPTTPARPYIASHPRPAPAAASKHRYGRKTFTCFRAHTVLTRPARALAGTDEFALRIPRPRPAAMLPQCAADAAAGGVTLCETFFGEVVLDNLRATRRHPTRPQLRQKPVRRAAKRAAARNRHPARRARLEK